jgi:DNA-binding helix-hairpin-helix protein with protein kinase domain
MNYTAPNGTIYSIVDAPFAGGGEGDVFDIPGSFGMVAKIYSPCKRTAEQERKLSAMVNIKPGVMEQYAWPLDVLYEDGRFAGFVMPRVTGREKLRNIYVYDKREGRPWTLYIAIAKNLAAAVYNVHEIGQVAGDLNPENILVDSQTGMVTLVDTDSYHITDSNGNVYRCGVGMPEFVAPELQGKHYPSEPLPTFTKESDEFALSVLMFALLMNGAHPFACKTVSGSSSMFQPIDNMVGGVCAYFAESSRPNIEIPKYAPGINSLPLDIQGLFHRSFVEGLKAPAMRPRAEEWYYALERLEQNIRKCARNSAHQYYQENA